MQDILERPKSTVKSSDLLEKIKQRKSKGLKVENDGSVAQKAAQKARKGKKNPGSNTSSSAKKKNGNSYKVSLKNSPPISEGLIVSDNIDTQAEERRSVEIAGNINNDTVDPEVFEEEILNPVVEETASNEPEETPSTPSEPEEDTPVEEPTTPSNPVNHTKDNGSRLFKKDRSSDCNVQSGSEESIRFLPNSTITNLMNENPSGGARRQLAAALSIREEECRVKTPIDSSGTPVEDPIIPPSLNPLAARKAVSMANRLGLGLKPGEINAVIDNPKAWATNQIRPVQLGGMQSGMISEYELMELYTERYRTTIDGQLISDVSGLPGIFAETDYPIINEVYLQSERDFWKKVMVTANPVLVRYAMFLANAVTISYAGNRWTDRQNLGFYITKYAFFLEQILPFAAGGTYADLLKKVEVSYQMSYFLDNMSNIGTNENLAREFLELHTVGINGGYGQEDVEWMAAILSGRRHVNMRVMLDFYAWLEEQSNPEDIDIASIHFGTPYFDWFRHNVQNRVTNHLAHIELPFIGYERDYNPQTEGRDILPEVIDLVAALPQTAAFFAQKARAEYFSDVPDDDIELRLAEVYLSTGGDLRAFMMEIIDIADEIGTSGSVEKFSDSMGFLISATRASGLIKSGDSVDEHMQKQRLDSFIEHTRLLKQEFSTPDTPEGYFKNKELWLTPALLLERLKFLVNLTSEMVNVYASFDDFYNSIMGGADAQPSESQQLIRQVGEENMIAGMLYTMMSEEFMRRDL